MKLVVGVIVIGIAACILADVSHLDGLSRMYLPPQPNQQTQFDQSSLKQSNLNLQQGAGTLGLAKPGQQYKSTPDAFNSGARQQLDISQSSFDISGSVNQLKSDGFQQQNSNSRFQSGNPQRQPGFDSLSSTSQLDCQQNPSCSPSGNDQIPQDQPLSIPRPPNQFKSDGFQQTISTSRFQQNANPQRQPGLDSLSSTPQLDCEQNPSCSPSGSGQTPQDQSFSSPQFQNQLKSVSYQQTNSNSKFQQNSNSRLQPGLDSLSPTSQLDCAQNPSCGPNQNGQTPQDQLLPNSRFPQGIQPRLDSGSTTPQYPGLQSQQTSGCCNQPGPLNQQSRKPLQGLQGLIRGQQTDVKIQEYLPPNASKDAPPSHTLEEDGYHYKVPDSNRLRY